MDVTYLWAKTQSPKIFKFAEDGVEKKSRKRLFLGFEAGLAVWQLVVLTWSSHRRSRVSHVLAQPSATSLRCNLTTRGISSTLAGSFSRYFEGC